MNIVQTMTDPNLFGDFFSDKSWTYWRELLAGFYGLPCDPSIFKELTHRDRPHAPSSELWMVIGRRGGKSQIAALLAVYEAVFRDYSPQLSKGEVATIAVIASDRKQARTIMRYIQGLLDTPMLRELVSRETHESIELMNRSVIEVFTASHRTTRGYTLACAICDEIAFWHSDGANPDREILQALRPSLATLNGKLIALSSPYARRGVLYQTYKDYFGRNSEILVAQAPTRTMNPTIPKSIVDRALLEDRSMAQAEYLAEFRTDVEAFISHEVVEQAMRSTPLELAPDYKTKYRAFVDPSGGSGDAYTLAIGHREGGCAVIDCVRVIRPPFSPEAATTELANVCKNYGIVFVKGDNYAGEWPKEQWIKHGIPYKKIGKPKSELYQDLLPALNSQQVELPPMPELERELLNLERRTSRGGRDSIDHPPQGHDDIANAVAGLCSMLQTQKTLCNPFANQTDIYGYDSPRKTYGYRMNL